MDDLPIVIRPAVADDLPFIFDTWYKKFHEVHPTNFIPNSIYRLHQTKLINAILSKTPVSVACIEDSPNEIVGYLVATPHDADNIIVHWAHVKGIFRRMGVMKMLLQQFDYQNKNLICSHFFSLFKQLRDKYNLIYDPTILEEYK